MALYAFDAAEEGLDEEDDLLFGGADFGDLFPAECPAKAAGSAGPVGEASAQPPPESDGPAREANSGSCSQPNVDSTAAHVTFSVGGTDVILHQDLYGDQTASRTDGVVWGAVSGCAPPPMRRLIRRVAGLTARLAPLLPQATPLCVHLDQPGNLAGLTVLELGAGTGAVGPRQ